MLNNSLRASVTAVFVSTLVGLAGGTLSAFFLVSLNLVTRVRLEHPALIWFLPLGGFVVALLYWRFGQSVEGGNDLVLDEIHSPRETIPFRMIPLILVGTWLTHLFGGSAGREGTAVQMGASAADQLSRKFPGVDRVSLLMAGLSAGFGSVFGVPFAGALFGIEVLSIGGLRVRRLAECTIASFIGHYTCLAWGVHHTRYAPPLLPTVDVKVIGYVALAGAAFGLIAYLFSWVMHSVRNAFRSLIPFSPLRAAVGGALVVAGFYFVSWDRYAGLSIDVIEASLKHSLPTLDWFWKAVFTILTLGSGMKGGEVTPLLFIGATFGNFIAHYIPLGFSILAALGFVSVFAGAANTPLACTLMAMEIFGPGIGLLALVSCTCAWAFSGYQGIYRSQRITRMKPFGGRRVRFEKAQAKSREP